MTRRLLPYPLSGIVALAIGTLAFVAPGAAGAKEQAQHHHHHRHVAGAVRQPPQPLIACTVLGCNPVPAGCRPVTGYTDDGAPTGYDAIYCP